MFRITWELTITVLIDTRAESETTLTFNASEQYGMGQYPIKSIITFYKLHND